MKKTSIYLLCYLSGSVLYPLIEIIARGYTHFSMSILGGICLCAIYFVHDSLGSGKILLKAALSSILITELEFICGIIVNRYYNLSVWDYSDRAFNLAGQICPLFSFFWFLLSLIAHALLSFEKADSKKTI